MNLCSIVVSDRGKCLTICTELKTRRKHKHVLNCIYTYVSEYAFKIEVKETLHNNDINLRDVKGICKKASDSYVKRDATFLA